jgi:hypothetical protein
MPLSNGLALVYVLRRSGCVGSLRSAVLERDGPHGLQVRHPITGEIIEYISGGNLRSWCVVSPQGEPVEGWSEVSPEDQVRIFPRLGSL